MARKIIYASLFLLLVAAAAYAKEPRHMKIADDQECADCHEKQNSVWLEGKHGLLTVKCIVCHGSTDKNFIKKADGSRCMGCHGEKVLGLKKKPGFKSADCFVCHDGHSLAVRFHDGGGK